MNESKIIELYKNAQEEYAELGVNTEIALNDLQDISISIHCWQGDDMGGFEQTKESLDGGLVATGNYPGKPRNPDELRMDYEKVLSLLPGKHRLNLHSKYAETGGKNSQGGRQS